MVLRCLGDIVDQSHLMIPRGWLLPLLPVPGPGRSKATARRMCSVYLYLNSCLSAFAEQRENTGRRKGSFSGKLHGPQLVPSCYTVLGCWLGFDSEFPYWKSLPFILATLASQVPVHSHLGALGLCLLPSHLGGAMQQRGHQSSVPPPKLSAQGDRLGFQGGSAGKSEPLTGLLQGPLLPAVRPLGKRLHKTKDLYSCAQMCN